MKKPNAGFYRMNNDKREFIQAPSSSNDDILKVFSVFLLLVFGILASGLIFVANVLFNFPSFVE